MERSDTIVELAKALSAFQGSMKSVPKTKINPHFGSTYADLDAIWEVCRKPLADNHLSLVQTTTDVNEQIYLDTLLLHISGEFITGRYPISPMRQVRDQGWMNSDDPQSLGSAITYARRYAMSAMLGVSADDDDDAEQSMKGHREKTAAPQARASAPADPSMMCPIHGIEWFKKGRMKGHAHKIEGTEEWCNMPKEAAQAPQEQASAPEVVSKPIETPTGDSEQGFKNLGELIEAAWVKHGQTRSGVAFLAEFESADAMTEAFKEGRLDLEDVWSKVVGYTPEA